MASKTKKSPGKVADRFTDEQAKAILAEINAEESADGRLKIYKRHGLSKQSAIRLFMDKNLPSMTPAKVPGTKSKVAAGKASKKTAKASSKASTTAPTPAPAKKTQAPKPAPAKKAANPGLDEDVRQLIALQARVISRLMGND
jgi:hypothetical protein